MSVSESLKLGALDLKKSANRNLAIGFGIALLIVVGLTGGGSKAFQPKEEIDTVQLISAATSIEEWAEEDLEAQEPPPPEEYVPPPPPPPAAATADVGTGSEGRMGQLIATTEEVEGPDVADMSEIEFADDIGGGDGGAAAFDPDAITIDDEVDLKDREASVPTEQPRDDYDQFQGSGTDIAYNQGELQANAEYPAIALENGMEGRVTLMVYIDERGNVDKVEVLKAPADVFKQSAIDAVKKTTFQPAIQNGFARKGKRLIFIDYKLR